MDDLDDYWSDALEACDTIDREYDDYAVYRFPWLPVQLAFLMDPSQNKDLRTGNQGLGKTTAGLAEDVFYALGRHPFREVPPPPCRIRVICATASQSIEIQEKLWQLVPRAELKPGVEFVAGQGFRGRDPKKVPFKNGSLFTFHTSYQSAIAQAGGTVDRIHFDEPPKNDRVFVEAKNRMIKTGGTLLLTFAPVNAEVGYLRELIDRGELSDHHSRMTERAMTPVPDLATIADLARRIAHRRGASIATVGDVEEAIDRWASQHEDYAPEPIADKHGQRFTDEYIAQLKAGIPAYQVPVVFDGEWEMYVVKRVYDRYDPLVHGLSHDAFWAELATADRRARAAGSRLKLSLGIDHGDGTDKSEAASLCVVDDSGPYPRFFEAGEYVSDGATTSDMDARAIIAMLQGSGGQRWSSLDFAIGDRPWQAEDRGKGNIDMAKALAKELGLHSWRDLAPQLMQAKAGALSGARSVETGIRYLHEAMVRPRHYFVNRDACPHLHEGLQRWDKKPRSPHVHICDTARYSKVPWQVGLNQASGVATVRRGG